MVLNLLLTIGLSEFLLYFWKLIVISKELENVDKMLYSRNIHNVDKRLYSENHFIIRWDRPWARTTSKSCSIVGLKSFGLFPMRNDINFSRPFEDVENLNDWLIAARNTKKRSWRFWKSSAVYGKNIGWMHSSWMYSVPTIAVGRQIHL